MRTRIVAELDSALISWLDLDPVKDACVESDHVLDALLSALVAIAAKSSSTRPPAHHELSAAGREGWIDVPARALVELKPFEGSH